LASTNFKNHVAVNFRSRSRRWLSLRLGNIAYFQGLPDARIKSWTKLLYWVGTTTVQTIVGLLPRYTSLQTPPQPVLAQLQSLIYQMRSSIGLLGLPVTDVNLSSHPEAYLPWMWQVLSDVSAPPFAGQPGSRVFTLMPQKSHQSCYITITSDCLHRQVTELSTLFGAQSMNEQLYLRMHQVR